MVLMVLATIASAAPQQQTEGIPPQLIETIPFEGEELQLDQAITLYFDQAMDRDSVEQALTVSGVDGAVTLTWDDDAALTIMPDSSWERAAEIQLDFATDAQTQEGVPLADPLTVRFPSIGYITVDTVIPASDAESISSDSTITVIFSRPVVPLVTIEEQADLPDPLVFDPPLVGSGEWINTSIYVFTPDGGLEGGITQNVTVTEGLASADGAFLQDPFTWSFSTIPPRVVEAFPENEQTLVPLDNTVRVRFTQAMDTAISSTAIRLLDLRDLSTVAGSVEWSDDAREATFTPDELFAIDGLYSIEVDPDVARSASGARLVDGWQSSFSTVPTLAILETVPTDGNQSAAPYGGFEVWFSAPVDADTLEDKVIIDPEPTREYETYYYDYNNRYSLFFDVEPSTSYTVTILPGIADPYGNEITTTTTITYTTTDYEPSVNLNIPDFAGLYSAYKPNTRVFATHRNISRLDLELYRLDTPVLSQLVGYDSYNARQNYFPPQVYLIRDWSVGVQSQPNTYRYELLLLSESGGDGIGNLECLGAPTSRMLAGDVGIVTVDDGDTRPLRIRTLPNLQGDIIDTIEPGTLFDVVDGPICADGYVWWNIQVPDSEVSGWSAEGTTENYFIEMVDRLSDPIQEDDLEQYPSLPPGAYYLNMTAPETNTLGYEPLSHVAIVSTVNITLKFAPDQIMAWVTNIETGEPVAGVPVQFHDQDFGMLGRLATDDNGVAILEIPRMNDLFTSVFAYIETDEHYGFASSNFDRGLSPWQFDINGDWEPENFSAYIYTDRPLYRPGQPVYFRGILRDREDVTFTVPTLAEVPVTIFDPEDQIVYQDTVALTPHGTFSGEFTLDDQAALGYYRLIVEVDSNRRSSYSLGFSVGEYVAPEFQVNVTPAEDEYVQGDDVEILVDASYFFGGAVSNATVEWSVLSRNYWFEYSGEGRYDFTDYNYDEGPGEYYDTYGELLAEGEGVTNEQGEFLLTVPADLGKKTQSQEYTIEARVIDESSQLVAGRATVIIHQGEVYAGLRPIKYIGQAETESEVEVLMVDWASEPVAEQAFDYRVVQRVWSSVQEEDPTGRTVYTWEVEEIDVTDGAAVTDDEGRAIVTYTPPEAGTYKVYVSTEDSLGNAIQSSTFMWVSGSNYVAWRQQNSNRFDLISDADQYALGDTAEILIASPFQGETTALITVERDGIISYDVMKMESNSAVYRLPITDVHAPNIFVSVMIIKGEDESNPYSEFRMGMIQLGVDIDRFALNVEVTPNVDVDAGEFAGPGDDVTYTIRTTDWEGNPVRAEVGIGVTDLAVLTLAPANSGPLLPHFYSERGLSVRTGTALTISVDRATQTIIDTVKGGGGGGSDQGIFDIREEFVDTPAWEPAIVTDEDGLATVTVTLPDNLTTWRLDARAVTDGADGFMLVGQTTTDLLSTKPLLVRPLTPRFMVVDDVVQLGTIVNNNTGDAQTVEVTLQGTGFTLADGQELTQTVEIPAQGRQRVNWDVTILDVPSVDLTFIAANDEYNDASKPTASQGEPLPVYKYETPEFVGTGGSLTDSGSRSELIALPRRFDVTQGELTIQVDRSLAAATVGGLEYLENFEHQCTEQTVSRFLPNVMSARALQNLGVYDESLQANLDQQVNFALQRLYATQQVSGGWGWFPQSRDNPLVTAYALLGLVEARNSGYVVDATVINGAASYIETEINGYTPNASTQRANLHAFYLFARARAGYLDVSQSAVLFDRRSQLNQDSKALLAMTLHLMNPADPRVNDLVADLVSAAILSSTGAHWEDEADSFYWVTDTRTTALVLSALVQIDADNALIPQAVRWLMVARNGDHWETTQETAWAVMGLTDWMVASGELRPSYEFNVGLNGAAQDLADTTATSENVTDSETLKIAVADLLKDEANRLTFTRTEGQGNLYYTAFLNAYLPVEEVEPVSRGLVIDRAYYRVERDENGTQRIPVTSGQVGDEIEVVLTIIAPNDLYYVMVEDPIPAGSAAVDPNLSTSSVLSESGQLTNTSNALRYGWGWWWFTRTEFRDEKVVMYADSLPAGSYEYRYTIRLGLAGEYRVMPPNGHEFYFPDVYGRGSGIIFTISEAEE